MGSLSVPSIGSGPTLVKAAANATLADIAAVPIGGGFYMDGATLRAVLMASTAAAPGYGGSLLPNLYLVIDAALPVTTGPRGTPLTGAGILADSNGNVLQVNDPVNGLKARVIFPGAITLKQSGPGGAPYFKSTEPAGTHSDYDGFMFDGVVGNQFFGAPSPAYCVIFVMKQTLLDAGNPGEYFITHTSDGQTTAYFGQYGTTGTDGSMEFYAGNGGTTIDTKENANALSVLNQEQILCFLYDGSTASIYRNGQRTMQTPSTATNALAKCNCLTFGRNSQSEISLILGSVGAPSITQLDAEFKRLGTKFNITVSTVTQGPANPIAPPTVPAFDATATFLGSPNFPISDALPTITAATPGTGVTLVSGATQIVSYIFGSDQTNANMLTGQSIRDEFYMNYIVGNQTSTFGSPGDTGQSNNNTYAAVARHYFVGDTHDTLTVDSEGLHIKAFASQNGTNTTPGNVWGGFIRLKPVFKPGCIIKIRYRNYRGDHGWCPIWLYTGEQRTPGVGGNPYAGNGTNNSLIRFSNKPQHEIDINDNFSRFGQGTPTGRQLDFVIPDIYGATWTTPPHTIWQANGTGSDGRAYVAHPGAGPDYVDLGVDTSAGFHDMLFNWRNDGSNLMDVLIDGKLVQTNYMEYGNAGTYVDQNGVTQTIGMHLMIGNQAIPSFAPGHDTCVDNDGVPDGWTITIQEISAWSGNVANPDSYRATA